MKFLLDVNALVALGYGPHEFHERVSLWIERSRRKAKLELATCSITELGFARVLSSAGPYQSTVLQAKALLLHLKRSEKLSFVFLDDAHDISRLPGWVFAPRQITDGHLLSLARANSFQLATLDQRIPGAFTIPD
jgi:uncharacterized protein